ncbi:MAG: hypothetical protein JRG91_11715 [Deltaproteobacteria bacterium]|nr:hypothetical protein [Deltaproteobacteria bacterium]
MKRTASVLLLSLLAFSASCKDDGGGEDAAVDETSDPIVEETADATDATEEDPGETEPTMDVNGRLETVDGIEVLSMWGTREEMGYAEGALLCGRIRDLFQDYVLGYVVPDSGRDYATITALVTIAYRLPEGDRRELEALLLGVQERCPAEDLIITSEHLEPAAGGSRAVTFDDLKVGHAIADWACSSLTAWGEASATGGTIHARNLDFLQDDAGVILDAHIVKAYQSSEDGGATWASVSFPGLIGCISCFNEEGTGITMHNITGLGTSGNAVPRMLAARQALVDSTGAADPVAAAEAALEACPQQVGNNLHFSMHCATTGCAGGAVFEFDGYAAHADEFATVRAPGDVTDGLSTTDAIVCTNHYMERDTPPTSGGSYDRYQTLVDGVNAGVTAGGLDVAGALALMATTSEQNEGVPTVHTVIMDTEAMTLRVYVPDSTSVEAPSATPHVLDLSAIFTAFTD